MAAAIEIDFEIVRENTGLVGAFRLGKSTVAAASLAWNAQTQDRFGSMAGHCTAQPPRPGPRPAGIQMIFQDAVTSINPRSQQ